MPASDWSDNEEITAKKTQNKRNKQKSVEKIKKRRRSMSADSNDNDNKRRRNKSKMKKYSDAESDCEKLRNKSKNKKYKENEDDVFTSAQNKKSKESKASKLAGHSESEDVSREHESRKRKIDKHYKNKPNCDESLDERKEKAPRDDKSKKPSRSFSEKKNKYNSGNESIIHENTGNYKRSSHKKSKQISDNVPDENKQYEKEKHREMRSRYDDDDQEKEDRERFPSNGSEDERNTVNSDKPFRYWSTSRGPVRKNSDSYWNKYSDRLKEPSEHMEVGPRYYSSGESNRKERERSSNNESRREKTKEDAATKEVETDKKKDEITPKPRKTLDMLTSRTGGAYIPPAKLKMMQESITDKASAAYQRLAWEALKKSIQGHVNKVNTSNIAVILKAVQKENIVRGRGLLCRGLIQAQAASPSFTNVYAAFVAVLNAKFPKIGELLLKRLIVQFRRGFKRNDKTICITAVTFIAHLVNQEVAHEILALEILTLLIETPTDDSVEVAIAFLKECGMKLTELSSKGVLAIFDMLRNILHEGTLDKRVQYMIEVMFQIRKEDFKAHPSVLEELDLVSEEDRIQHMVTLEENHDPEDILNVFKFDPDYEANEAKYKSLVYNSDEESGSEASGDSDNESGSEEEEDEEGGEKTSNGVIVDKTETNLVALRKTIYLTIQSSLDFEECAHKLLRMQLKPGQEVEMAHMFLDCCAEQRTYEKFFGLLSQRFCQINRAYIGPFEQTFRDSYETIHRMSNDKLRNVAKLFAHLLFTDAISWEVLSIIRLNEDDTTSSSRIFIKILFLELSEYMGLAKLNQRVKDPSLQSALEGVFPRDNPKHTRFAINFFTSIGLGGLTDELREHLKAQPKPTLAVPQLVDDLSSTSSESSSSDSSDSSSSDSDSSSSDSSSSDSEPTSRKKKKNKASPISKKKTSSVKRVEKEVRKSTKRIEDKSSRKRKVTPPKNKRGR